MSHKINQEGFSAIEALLLAIIIVLIAGIGYYIYHANQQSNTTLTAPSSVTQTKVTKAASVISLDKSQLPSGWKTTVDTPSTISLAEVTSKCTVLVSQTANNSLTPDGAKAFTDRKVAALKNGNGVSVDVGTPADQMVGSQTISMYPVTVKDKGQITNNQKVGYLVGKGYYVSVIENCQKQASDLTQADQALQAVTIKS